MKTDIIALKNFWGDRFIVSPTPSLLSIHDLILVRSLGVFNEEDEDTYFELLVYISPKA